MLSKLEPHNSPYYSYILDNVPNTLLYLLNPNY